MNQAAPTTHVNRTQLVPRLREPVIVVVPPATRRNRQRAARQTLLWGLAAILFAHLALAVSIEKALPQVRDPEYGYRLVRVREQQRIHPDRPLVVILGTSRTQNAINPAAMSFPDKPGSPMVFNFGQSGSHPLHVYLTLQRVLADGVRPSVVLVEICPPTMTVPGPADYLYEANASRLTLHDIDRLTPHLQDPGSLRRDWAAARFSSLHSQRLVLLSHLAPWWQPWQQRVDFQWAATDDAGFTAYPADKIEENRAKRTERARSEYDAALHALHVNEMTVRAFSELVRECRVRAISVAFYLAPESPVFQSWYSPESKATLAAFKRMVREEWGCPVFDAPQDYSEEDFADGHHMLPTAAERYSRWLAEYHFKPWFAEVLQSR